MDKADPSKRPTIARIWRGRTTTSSTAMDEAQPDPHPLQRNVMLVLLLALAAAAWAVLVGSTTAQPWIWQWSPLISGCARRWSLRYGS